MIKLSIIVPVYNRPDEVSELLKSLAGQSDTDFEVVIVEDGSSVPCRQVCGQFDSQLNLHYYVKPNSGRSETRNFGMNRAAGDYFIIFDSDCILPPQYIATVRRYLQTDYADCFGGPDAADRSFTRMQRAISYSMTSFLTTGGIRGGMKNADKFSPRSFNMGISKEVYQKVGGFRNMIGEDIDLSIRIKEAGYKTKLYPKAFVYHKRRVNLRKFYRQVHTFGRARILLEKVHPSSLKPVHLLPSLFVLGNGLLAVLSIAFLNAWFLLPILLYVAVLFTDSLVKNKSIPIAALSVVACYTQLFGYGLGFLAEWITRKATKARQEELYGK